MLICCILRLIYHHILIIIFLFFILSKEVVKYETKFFSETLIIFMKIIMKSFAYI
jgi:hypothetical protein